MYLYVLGPICFVLAIPPLHELGLILFILTLGVGLFVISVRRRYIFGALGLSVVFLYSFYSSEIGEINKNRLLFLMENVTEVGLLKGYLQIPSIISENPGIPFVGTGPGEYGSLSAFAKARLVYPNDYAVLAFGPMLFYKSTESGDEFGGMGGSTSVAYQTSDVIAILMEFGFVGFFLFFSFYSNLMKTFRGAFRRSPDQLLGSLAFGCFLYLLFVLCLMMTGIRYSVYNPELVFPFFLLGGGVHSLLQQEYAGPQQQS